LRRIRLLLRIEYHQQIIAFKMKESLQIAKQFREVHLDGKWVVSTNLKLQLTDTTWQEATTKIEPLNTIAALAFHINYYVAGVSQVLEGGTLDIRDKYSFDMPPIESEQDWQNLLTKLWKDAERFAVLIEQLPDDKLNESFVDEKYGDYRRNLHVLVEHTYYHLGQIVLLKKLLAQKNI